MPGGVDESSSSHVDGRAPSSTSAALAAAAHRVASAATVAAASTPTDEMRPVAPVVALAATDARAAACVFPHGEVAARVEATASAPGHTPSAADTPAGRAAAAMAAAGAAGRAAATAATIAVANAVAAASSATPGRGHGGRGGRGKEASTRGVAELEGTLHRGVVTWSQRNRPRAVAPVRAYVAPVAAQVLQSAETTRETLRQLCVERTIPFGADDSTQSLKASLVRWNATSSTVWGARMQWLAVYLRTEAQRGRGNLAPFQAAMAHPGEVVADQPDEADDAMAQPRDSPTPTPSPSPRVADARPPRYPPVPVAGVVSPMRGATRSPSPSPGPPSLPVSSLSAALLRGPSCAPHSDDDAGTPTSSGLLSSSQHAALMLQSMAAEQDQRVKGLATSVELDVVKGMVSKLTKGVTASAQSAAASAGRVDGALAQLVSAKTTLTAAAATITAALPVVGGTERRASKRARLMGGPAASLDEQRPGGGGSDGRRAGGAGVAAHGPAASEKHEYFHALVHNMAMPPEMLTGKMPSESLFTMLEKMVRACHITAGQPGIFGSLAVHQLYRDGVERTEQVLRKGGATGMVNAAKSELMSNVIKNKVKLYLRQLNWMHAVLPDVLQLPGSASYENMQKAELNSTQRAKLKTALRQLADEYRLPADHPLREPITAKAHHLRKQVNNMSGRPGTPSAMSEVLATSPFCELLAAATENMKKKYN